MASECNLLTDGKLPLSIENLGMFVWMEVAEHE
jgi:hypothetical protein